MNLEDTIVAVSSPPGVAARGIVRISGPAAFPILASLTDRPPATVRTPTYFDAEMKLASGALPAGLYLFPPDLSYTREALVEIHTVGSPPVLGMVVEFCLAQGARPAEPGEFTARAFMSGVLDLSQVHGIAGMIAARSDLQVKAAERLLHGALSRTALRARDELADLLSLIEGAMDFADEPIEFIAPTVLSERLSAVLGLLSQTAAAGMRAEEWQQLPRVVLFGAANAGKSSLLNHLAGMDRAICAPVAGTTRDVLSAPMPLPSGECLLIDVAGLVHGTDGVERAAQSAAVRAVRNADLLVWVVDSTEAADARMPSSCVPDLLAANKCDLFDQAGQRAIRQQLSGRFQGPVCLTSAVTGEGCEELASAIDAELQGLALHGADDAIALMVEHRESLQRAQDSLHRAVDLAAQSPDNLDDADLVAAELHSAADALGTLVGRDQTEDLLGRIFSRFCVGK